MANIFWPIGDRINGVPLKKEVENAWIEKCIALFSYLPIYIAKIKPHKILTLQNWKLSTNKVLTTTFPTEITDIKAKKRSLRQGQLVNNAIA